MSTFRTFLVFQLAAPLLLISLCFTDTALAKDRAGNSGLDALLSLDPREMEFAPVEFSPPKPERVPLDNGMIVYLLPDHELPLISMSLTVKTGDIYEPADKVGLAGMTGALMRTGGAGSRTGDEIDEALEFISANVSAHIGSDSGSASLDVLKKDFEFALGFLSTCYVHHDLRKINLTWQRKEPSRTYAEETIAPPESRVGNSTKSCMANITPTAASLPQRGSHALRVKTSRRSTKNIFTPTT